MIFRNFLLGLLGLIVLASLVVAFEDSETDFGRGGSRNLLSLGRNGEYLHNLKRKVGKTESKKTLFLDTLPEYGTGLVSVTLAFLILAGLSFGLSLIFCVCLVCAQKREMKEPRKRTTLGLRILILILSIVLIATAVASISGHRSFQPAVSGLAKTIRTATQTEGAKLASIETRLSGVNPNITSADKLLYQPNLEANTADVLKQGDASFTRIDSNRVYIDVFMGITWAFIFLCSIFGIFSCIFPRSMLALTLGLTLVIPLVLTWLCVALYFPLSVVCSDFCYDFTEYTVRQRLLDRQQSNFTIPLGGIDTVFRCLNKFNHEVYTVIGEDITVDLQAKLAGNPPFPENETYIAQLAIISQVQADLDDSFFCSYMDRALTPLGNDYCTSNLNSAILVWVALLINAIAQMFLMPISLLAAYKFKAAASGGYV